MNNGRSRISQGAPTRRGRQPEGGSLLFGQILPKTALNEENWTEMEGASEIYYVDPPLMKLFLYPVCTLYKKDCIHMLLRIQEIER